MTTHHRADDRTRWLALIERVNADTPKRSDLEAFAKKAASDGLRTAVLCGMGGSSLAPEVFSRTYGAADGALEPLFTEGGAGGVP